MTFLFLSIHLRYGSNNISPIFLLCAPPGSMHTARRQRKLIPLPGTRNSDKFDWAISSRGKKALILIWCVPFRKKSEYYKASARRPLVWCNASLIRGWVSCEQGYVSDVGFSSGCVLQTCLKRFLPSIYDYILGSCI